MPGRRGSGAENPMKGVKIFGGKNRDSKNDVDFCSFFFVLVDEAGSAGGARVPRAMH